MYCAWCGNRHWPLHDDSSDSICKECWRRVFSAEENVMSEKYSEGDIESKERGTTARANRGKVQFSLVPLHLLHGAAKVLMHGCKKYSPWNWAKGGLWSTAFDSLLRHLLKWWYFREEYDRESGLHHLDHAMCNLLFLLHYKDTYEDGDNRPPSQEAAFWQSMNIFNQHQAGKNAENE